RVEDGERRPGLANQRGDADPLGPGLHPGSVWLSVLGLALLAGPPLVLRASGASSPSEGRIIAQRGVEQRVAPDAAHQVVVAQAAFAGHTRLLEYSRGRHV